MNFLRHFIIPFSGLKVGKYTFTFEVDNKFFDQFEYSEIKKGELQVTCELERQPRMMILDFDIGGYVRVPCDRCAEEFNLPLSGKQRLIVKFGAEHEEEAEDVLIITEQEHELDISQFIYEFIHLLLPIQKIHGTDENGKSLCNPDVIRYISHGEEHHDDPRWEALQKLKEKES